MGPGYVPRHAKLGELQQLELQLAAANAAILELTAQRDAAREGAKTYKLMLDNIQGETGRPGMTKTFCDRCGAECVYYNVALMVSEVQTTSRGDEVDENYSRNHKHLCKVCKESLEAWFGTSLGFLSEAEWEQRETQMDAERAELAVPKAVGLEAHP